MRINIDELLNKQNKTRYWLSKEIGFTYPNLCKLCNNQTESVKFDILEKICIALDCEPNDILKIKDS